MHSLEKQLGTVSGARPSRALIQHLGGTVQKTVIGIGVTCQVRTSHVHANSFYTSVYLISTSNGTLSHIPHNRAYHHAYYRNLINQKTS